MSSFVDDTLGIDGGAFYDPSNGNTALQSFGPSGCISIEDQNDYAFGIFDPNSGNAYIRSGDTISGSMRIESVCGEIFFGDGFFHNYTLTETSERSLVSGYENYSIVGNFNEIHVKFESVTEDQQTNFQAGSVSGGNFSGSPKTYDVVLGTSLLNTNYAIAITSQDKRTWTWENKTVSGFTIHANANQALVGVTDWQIQTY